MFWGKKSLQKEESLPKEDCLPSNKIGYEDNDKIISLERAKVLHEAFLLRKVESHLWNINRELILRPEANTTVKITNYSLFLSGAEGYISLGLRTDTPEDPETMILLEERCLKNSIILEATKDPCIYQIKRI